MGVEYAHGLFVADLSWKPSWAAARAVVDVLAAWKLVAPAPQVFQVGGETTEIAAARAFQGAMPANVLIKSDGTEDKAVVEKIVGASAQDTDDRYIQSIEIVFGSDFKVLMSEAHGLVVESPPTHDGMEIEVSDDYTVTWSEIYPASWQATPPTIVAHGPVKLPRGFTGAWRSGVIIDCGKDVPAIVETGEPLPAKDLVDALERAFGTKLVEVSWIY